MPPNDDPGRARLTRLLGMIIAGLSALLGAYSVWALYLTTWHEAIMPYSWTAIFAPPLVYDGPTAVVLLNLIGLAALSVTALCGGLWMCLVPPKRSQAKQAKGQNR